MKILILANHVNSIVLFRMELLDYLKKKEHEIVISLPVASGETRELLEMGIRIIDTPLEQRGMNPLKDIRLLQFYKKIVREEKPDKIITYTVKCNIYGGLACKNTGIDFFPNITGLGYAFQKKGIVKSLVSVLYRIGLKRAERIFVENPGIRDELIDANIVREEQCFVLHGAGVNVDRFRMEEYPKESPIVSFLFVGRIMREKGVSELIDAVSNLHRDGIRMHISFVGPMDEEYKLQIKGLCEKGIANYWGYQSDVRPYLKEADCLVLPSWHEGMANVLLEAASTGRPILTSNIHGCKEAVIPNETGLLFDVQNSSDLEEKMREFISTPYAKKKKMGINGRKYMEAVFDKRKVVEETATVVLGC